VLGRASAGITLAAGIISGFAERPVRHNYAMTGEITLRGKVLPVGGIKEKVLAARRANIENVILPADNKKDLVDIPQDALRDLNIIFVEDMQQVMDAVLLEPPVERKRDRERREIEKDERTGKSSD
jgi:ATP-dependent Lon protease